MKNITRINADEVVGQSDARHFLILLQTDNGMLLTWRGHNSSQIVDDHNEASVFRRAEAVEQYNRAFRHFRDETHPDFFTSGRLDIVPLVLPIL